MKTVLIVDDNPSGRELSEAALSPLGCAQIFASDGKEALTLVRSRRPDLILLDLRMSGVDGFGVVQELRNDPDAGGVCIVAFTACAMQGDRESALAAGFSGFIAKPVGIASLRAQVSDYLNLHESMTETFPGREVPKPNRRVGREPAQSRRACQTREEVVPSARIQPSGCPQEAVSRA